MNKYIQNSNFIPNRPRKSISDINVIDIRNQNQNYVENTDTISMDKALYNTKLPPQRSMTDPRLANLMKNINYNSTNTNTNNNFQKYYHNYLHHSEVRRNSLSNGIANIKIPDPPFSKKISGVIKNFLETLKSHDENIMSIIKYVLAFLSTTAFALAVNEYSKSNGIDEFMGQITNALVEVGGFFENNSEAIIFAGIVIIIFVILIDRLGNNKNESVAGQIEISQEICNLYAKNELIDEADQTGNNLLNVKHSSGSNKDLSLKENEVVNLFNFIKGELITKFSFTGISKDDILSMLLEKGIDDTYTTTHLMAEIIEYFNSDKNIKKLVSEINDGEEEEIWKYIEEDD